MLTLHVLDVTRGVPAAGVGYTLARLDGREAERLAEATTDADGRSGGSVPGAGDLPPGTYELTFAVGRYFGTEAPRYLDEVPIRFGVGAEDSHVHVALLVTPWSYTTYRGS